MQGYLMLIYEYNHVNVDLSNIINNIKKNLTKNHKNINFQVYRKKNFFTQQAEKEYNTSLKLIKSYLELRKIV